jgi:hypothetical protein
MQGKANYLNETMFHRKDPTHASDPELKDFPTVTLETKIMQDLPQNLLRTPYLVEGPNRFLDLGWLGPCGSESSRTYENQQLHDDELRTCVPKVTNLLNSEVLPFLWNNLSYIQYLLLSIIELRTISRTSRMMHVLSF